MIPYIDLVLNIFKCQEEYQSKVRNRERKALRTVSCTVRIVVGRKRFLRCFACADFLFLIQSRLRSNHFVFSFVPAP